MRYLVALASLFALWFAAVSAQSQAAPIISKKGAAAGPDIIVNGIPAGPFPNKIDANTGFALEGAEAAQAIAEGLFFSRCITTRDSADLRGVIDGIPNGNDRINALDRLIRNHRPCYPNYVTEPSHYPPFYGDCNPRGHYEPIMGAPNEGASHVVSTRQVYAICQAPYDRGALVERALALYAPDLEFTTEQLADPAVLARFHAREDRFNATRSQGDRIFAEVTACLVAIHPNLALAYFKANSKGESRLRAAMIGTAPQCVGGAKRVSIDPSQFRIYLADALYSWAVALRGKDSLIPDGSGNERAN